MHSCGTGMVYILQKLMITPCACAQQGLSDRFVSRLSVCLSVDTKISSLSSEGLVEGLVSEFRKH